MSFYRIHRGFRARGILLVAAALLAGACTIVDRGPLSRAEGNSDSGPALAGANACGAAQTPLLNEMDLSALGGDGIMIDTTQATNGQSSNCGRGIPGNDLFFAVDVAAGDYWHFHLRTDPSDADSANRDPVLYLFQGGPENQATGTRSCGDRSCDFYADRCSSNSDEHFAFVASSEGRWFLGIDDFQAGGGRYILTAYHPNCGDGTLAHGEACDDGNDVNTDTCDNACRKVIVTDGATESRPNDNIVEANVLDIPVSGSLRVRGTVGGATDCYPDVYAINMPANSRLQVTALESFAAGTEVPCDGGTDAPFSLVVRDRAGGSETSGGTDGNGCPILQTGNLAEGEYIVTIDTMRDQADAIPYWMSFQVLPGT